MEEINRKRSFGIGLRARLPMFTRVLAISVLIGGVGFVAVSYYRLRNISRFVMKGKETELSKEEIGRVEGYERRITKDGRLYLLVRASRDISFLDGHHELENVSLEIYPPVGDKPDQIKSNRAILDKKDNIVSFLGSVKVETKDALKVETESLVYNQATEVATTDSPMSFNRENVSGHAVGAVVEGKTKKLELRQAVEIVVAPETSKDAKAKPTSTRSRPVTIRAAHALFEQESKKLSFTGGVTAEQEADLMSGDDMYGTLNDQKHLQKLEVRGNSYLRSMDPGHASELHSVDMDFYLDKDQRLERAVATRDTRGRSLDADSEMQISGANVIDTAFQPQADSSLLKEMRTEGRSVVTLSVPKSRANDPRAKSKRLIADAIKLVWRSTGRDLERAEAVGNAELYVEPAVTSPTADRITLTAARFDGDFYEAGNLAHSFVATGSAKAVLVPLQPTEHRNTRTITAGKMSALFARETQDAERIDAQGDTKFNEGDRNGTAATMVYTAIDDTVRLRGGEPTVWDSRARSKAAEMDSDFAHDISYSRGKTATTYYSQEETKGATPFAKVKSPVYIVSDRAELHHDTNIGIYTGNARAWQDDNFVRGDELTIFVDEKRMTVKGHVQSALYDATRKEKGVTTVVPVFATADSMSYSDLDHMLHYENNVDIRQATDRITSGMADVFLMKDSNKVERTVAQRNVVLTQPGRKGTGDWLQYTHADEISVLKGNPARVEDAEQGTTQSGRLTVYMRESRVVADDARGSLAPGRVHSSHKINKKP